MRTAVRSFEARYLIVSTGDYIYFIDEEKKTIKGQKESSWNVYLDITNLQIGENLIVKTSIKNGFIITLVSDAPIKYIIKKGDRYRKRFGKIEIFGGGT